MFWVYAATAGSIDDALKVAAQSYFAGQIIDAVAGLDAAADAAMEDRQKLNLRSMQMDICAAAYDYGCLREKGPEFVKLVSSIEPQGALRAKAIYLVILERFLARDLTSIETNFGFDFALRLADPLHAPDIAISLYVLSARIETYRGNADAAADFVSRAFATLLTLRPGSNYIAARTVAQLVELLDNNKNPVKASRWASIARPLFAALPPKSPDALFHLLTLLDLGSFQPLQDETSGKQFFAIVAVARDLASGLQVATAQKEYWLSSIASYEFGADLILGRLAEAHAALDKNPIKPRREEVIRRGRFANFEELLFALCEAISDGLSGQAPDGRWEPPFGAEPGFAMSGSQRQLWDAYAMFGEALLSAKLAPERAREALREAGRHRLLAVEAEARRFGDAYPLPSFVDRILLALAAAPTGSTPIDADLLLRSLEFLNRDTRSLEGDALSLIARQQDHEGRDLIHSLLRLSDQQSSWEASRLEELVQLMTHREVLPVEQSSAFNAATMASFVHLRHAIMQTIEERGIARSTGGVLTSPAALQSSLRPDEAFVGYVVGAVMTRVCVREDAVRTSTLVGEPANIATAIKLILSALGSQNPADEILDRQYPAKQAVEVFHTLFDGLEACLHPGDHLIFLPPADVAPLAISALLTQEPARSGDGYDLQNAKWLIREHPISYVASLEAFISARQLSVRETGDLPFLGVGDPQLMVRLADGALAGQALARRGISVSGGTLRDLEELPDAARELRNISDILGRSRSELLTGGNATLERFLSYPLSRFRILHFATHGLIRGDLPGLDEMALVLTPVDESDVFNDGLLTASKIANLDLKAKLVVLSACNTAGFDAAAFGSQIQGLTTALAIAGVPTTVAALWPVESKTGAQIMTGFYGHLLRHDAPTVAQALQRAVIDAIENPSANAFAHPRFWAPFVVYGDGGTQPSLAASTEPIAMMSTDVEAGGGEILGAVSAGRDFVTAEIGPNDNGRSPSLVRRRAPDGKVVWTLSSKDVGAGPIARAGAVSVIGGYLPSRPGVPTVRAVSDEGVTLWQKEFGGVYKSGTLLGLAGVDDGSSLLAIGPADPASEKSGPMLIRLDAAGDEVKRVQLPFVEMPAGYAVFGRSGLVADKQRAIFAVNSGRSIGETAPGQDDFGLPQMCAGEGRTYLYSFYPKTLEILQQTAIRNGDLISLLLDGDRIIVAGGNYLTCRLGQRAVLAELDPQLHITVLWRDDGPFDSFLRSVVKTASGYRAVGTIQRTVAIREPRPMKPGDLALEYEVFRKHHDYDRFTNDEALLIESSGHGTIEHTAILDTGLPLFVTGVALTDRDTVIFGSNGFNPWWAVLGR